jgi:hypothetical protein
VSAYPHRQFFGISDTQFGGEYSHPMVRSRHWLRWDYERRHKGTRYYSRRIDHYGKVPIDEFLTLEDETVPNHQPGSSDVIIVQEILYQKGLPAELVLEVMKLAGYKPLGRLSEPHDPFHISNRRELARYITYCWQLLVRCDMMAKALDMEIPWKELLGNCIADFWADDRAGNGRFFWYLLDEYKARRYKVFVKP